MATELFGNTAASTLTSTPTSGSTTITVNSATPFPAGGNFRLLVDSELMLCTGVSSNTFTVTRGVEGTTAASHASGAAVTHILTAASLIQAIQDRNLYTTWANRPAAGVAGRTWTQSDGPYQSYDDGAAWHTRAYGSAVVEPPAVNTFTWKNQGSSTAVNTGPILLTVNETGSTNNSGMVVAAPATPYLLTPAFTLATVPNTSSFQTAGILFRASSSGKMTTLGFNANNGVNSYLNVLYWTNDTTATTNLYQMPGNYWMTPIWFQIGDDGTHRNYYISPDGINFLPIYQETSTNNFTANQIGFYGDCSTQVSNILLQLVSWQVH